MSTSVYVWGDEERGALGYRVPTYLQRDFKRAETATSSMGFDDIVFIINILFDNTCIGVALYWTFDSNNRCLKIHCKQPPILETFLVPSLCYDASSHSATFMFLLMTPETVCRALLTSSTFPTFSKNAIARCWGHNSRVLCMLSTNLTTESDTFSQGLSSMIFFHSSWTSQIFTELKSFHSRVKPLFS